MVRIYRHTTSGITRADSIESLDEPFEVAWVDLLFPEIEEVRAIEARFGIDVPTRDDMREIEASSRLYTEDGARFMTTTILTKPDGDVPRVAEVSFILLDKMLITTRHNDSYSFRIFSQQLLKQKSTTRDTLFLGILEIIIDRQADLLERFGSDLDGISKEIFEETELPRKRRKTNEQHLRSVISSLGKTGDLVARQRDCLVNLNRLLSFAGQEDIEANTPSSLNRRVSPLARDVSSLSEYASFLTSKVNFMLDATLGLISIEQNTIVKLFTVAAVMFMPPTLIASIYGMNFHKGMPELDWSFGYPMALILMLISVMLPLWIFRKRGWL